ncbi:MAG: FAD-dependent oxidoreductase [Dehalococcoidales bacterium]|nr:FAD-dependent oxidoreductase [Dehalococcoidales bacterium]
MVEKLQSVADLEQLYQKAGAKQAQHEANIQVKVHLGSCGIASGADKVLKAFEQELEVLKSHTKGEAAPDLEKIEIQKAACIGLCGVEPTVTVLIPGQEKTVYYNIDEAKTKRIFKEHLLQGTPVKEWLVDLKSPRIALQEIRVLHNQDLDPLDIEQYISRGGYMALGTALSRMKPEEVIEEVKKAGLRGRGGAGFAAATKWGFVRSAISPEKYVVCNGDEGDPGAYMNRAVLEGNPHSIIEGMAIGAYAIGNVKEGFAYVRAEYPLAIETLSHAIAQAREYGLLGKNILGTDFEFSIDIFPGAGAFVCGEETALLTSIEGKRGNPRQRPPFPANPGGGLFGKPTTINNVETWSDVPEIILRGSGWFTGVGNEKSKGTKTLCLVGKVNNPGLVEVPLGTPLGKLVFDIGGGIPNGKKFKAAQLGGPSGGVIPAEHINTPIDYESVAALGAIMGSGGVVIMDESSCMVDVAKFFLQFTREESCGKCAPCRAGIPQLLEILEKISRGEAEMADLDTLTDLAEMVTSASLCGLGQTSANPILTTLRHFREEYEAHIIDKKCPAAVCRGLFKAPCQHTCPVELDIPGYVSFIKEGKFTEAYTLIKQRNPLPAICGRVCHHPCESKCNRNQVDEAVAIRDLKRFAADFVFDNNIKIQQKTQDKKAEKIAVIGAGPAGLSAANDLALAGYSVTIFEALPVAGGMLAVAIPEYRLPKNILQKEIDDIKELGVEIKLNSPVKDATGLLKDGYQAVFIATGAHQGMKMGIPGEELTGVYDAIEFLRNINLGNPVELGKRVAVIGGGNSAIDSARVAVRKGAEVHLVYRRERGDMPAIDEEIKAAEEEGVKFHFLSNPVKILGTANVKGLVITQMELGEFDRSGRKVARPVAGSETQIEVDTVIEAIGQRPDTSIIKGEGTVIAADKRTLATAQPGIFAGGDAVTGPQTVIEAIAQGQRAASSIKRYLKGEALSPRISRDGYEPIAIPQTAPTDEETKEKARIIEAEIPVKERLVSFKEVSLAYTPEEARQEAARCLRCDLDVGG